MIQGILTLENSEITDQDYFLTATGSDLTFTNIVYRNTTVTQIMFKVDQSDMRLTNITLSDFQSSLSDLNMFYLLNTILMVDTMEYSNSNIKLMTAILTTIDINFVTLKDLAIHSEVMFLRSIQEQGSTIDGNTVYSHIKHSSFKSISGNTLSSVIVSKSDFVSFENVTFIGFVNTPLQILSSRIRFMKSLYMSNNKSPLKVQQSVISLIENSTFEN